MTGLHHAAPRRVHELFEDQTRRTPEAVALVVGGRRISYTELDARADAVAGRLAARGIGRGALVGVCVPRDERLVAALLGVLKSGAGYVPLDPAYPAERRRFIERDARLHHLLMGDDLVSGADATTDAATDGPGSPADVAYVMYTSGSTGLPKGVIVEHRNVVNLLWWEAASYGADELRGVLAATSICFDPSVTQLFLPLVTGGTAILADHLLAATALPARDDITLVNGAPSALAALLRDPLPPAVSTVIAGGEALTRALADRVYANRGVRRLVNAYGPTECTTTCVAAEVPRDGRGQPPIGRPYARARVSVRAPDGAVLPDGSTGELWIAGPGVARGYLHRPELTAARFVTDPGPDGGRWYRTGDLVRAAGGELHFAGRSDHQVKVRGHRVELGEVEHALAAHPAVRLAVAAAPADVDGGRRLVGYVELAPDATTGEAELRAYLRERLPEHLVPSRLAVLDRIPCGPTGKVDRAALPAIAAPATAPATYVAPRDPIEQRVAGIVAEVVGAPRVGVFDRFTELGGHSLAAARVVARAGEELGAIVPISRFLAEPTVAALAAHVAAGAAGRAGGAGGAGAAGGPHAVPPPVRHAGRTAYPLTDLQREFWTLRELSREPAVTTAGLRLRLTGLAGAAPLRAALDGVVRRHEVLRTVVDTSGEEPVALVRRATAVPVTEHDVRHLPLEERAAALEMLAGQAMSEPFDLAADVPLLRAALIWTRADRAELVVTTDHCAFDGYSAGLLMAELVSGLTGPVAEPVAGLAEPVAGLAEPVAGRGPALQVGDLAVYERRLAERADDVAAAMAFWRTELAGAMPPYGLGDRGPRTFRGDRVVRPLDRALVAQVAATAAGTGATPFAVYLAALGVVLCGLTGQTRTLIGAVSARRDRPGVERVIGPLVGVLPIRVALDDAPPFGTLAARVAETTGRALAHQDLPASAITGCAEPGPPPGSSLTPVLLSMQPPDLPLAVEGGGVRVELLGELGAGAASGELTVFVNETVDGPQLQAEYDAGRFAPAAVSELLDRWLRVLRAATRRPDRPVSTVELLADEERAGLLAAAAGPPLPADRPATVIEAVLDRAARTPHTLAVSAPTGQQTYAELAARSAQIAAGLVAAGIGPGTVVAAGLTRDHLMPATLLGIWRAGAAYLPLEVDQPAQRQAYVLADAGAAALVTSGGSGPVPDVVTWSADDLAAGPGAGGVWSEERSDEGRRHRKGPGTRATGGSAGKPGPGARATGGSAGEQGSPGSATLPACDPDALAYVLYTSGSSGRPKGVEVSHANLAAFSAGISAELGYGPGTVMLAATSLSFDVAGAELWAPLASGSRVEVAELADVTDGYRLAERIADAGVTTLHATPTLLRILLAAGWPGDGRVRVISAGEPLDPALARELLGRAGELWNAYGPTEATVIATMHRVTDASATSVPIGRPLPGVRTYVVDPLGRLCPPGAPGELWIGGAGVASGYRGRPELTAAVFGPDPFAPGGRRYRSGDLVRWRDDGTIDFIGRTDGQVKLRGYRIELGEVESVLREHPGIADAVVTVDGAGADARLVGYVVPGGSRDPVDPPALAGHARDRLAEYMVPRCWVVLDALPRLPSGKVDRAALPPPGRVAAGPAPDTATERLVAAVWAEVLDAPDIRTGDDFFALGGHSYAAVRTVGRLHQALGCRIPVRLLFDHPVLADFVVELESVAIAELRGAPAGADA